jgi:hypothetical protein
MGVGTALAATDQDREVEAQAMSQAKTWYLVNAMQAKGMDDCYKMNTTPRAWVEDIARGIRKPLILLTADNRPDTGYVVMYDVDGARFLFAADIKACIGLFERLTGLKAKTPK